jgi:hypothetical protein
MERHVMAAHKQIDARKLAPVVIDADTVAIVWRFDFTTLQGTMRTLEEVAWQTWRGEQLLEERFFYDPQQMLAERPVAQEVAAVS